MEVIYHSNPVEATLESAKSKLNFLNKEFKNLFSAEEIESVKPIVDKDLCAFILDTIVDVNLNLMSAKIDLENKDLKSGLLHILKAELYLKNICEIEEELENYGK